MGDVGGGSRWTRVALNVLLLEEGWHLERRRPRENGRWRRLEKRRDPGLHDLGHAKTSRRKVAQEIAHAFTISR